MLSLHSNTYNQSVLNDLYSTMISCRRILLSLYLVSNLSLFHCLHVCRQSSLLTGKGGMGGAKSYDGEKAWSSVNHSILSAYYPPPPKKNPTTTIWAVHGMSVPITNEYYLKI